MIDPTVTAIDRQVAEREQLRAEVDRLSRTLVDAYTAVEVLTAERDAVVRGCDVAERERDAEHGRAELCSQDARVAHSKIDRLARKLEEAYTTVEALTAERDRLASDGAFEKGYDQAVREIRDHFAKAGDHDVVHVIKTIWKVAL